MPCALWHQTSYARPRRGNLTPAKNIKPADDDSLSSTRASFTSQELPVDVPEPSAAEPPAALLDVSQQQRKKAKTPSFKKLFRSGRHAKENQRDDRVSCGGAEGGQDGQSTVSGRREEGRDVSCVR